MEYKNNCDTYEKVSGDDAKRKISQNNQAMKSGGQYKDVPYSDLQSTEKDRTQYSVEIGDSDTGTGHWCRWKVTAIVFIALTVLLLIIVLATGGFWLKEPDNLAVSQKTSMEGAKQLQDEEEQKRVQRGRDIGAEEERKREEREREIREEEKRRIEREREIMVKEEEKRVEREREIRAEEEQKRVEREQEIRAEEKQKRVEREREIRAEEEKKRTDREQEIRAEEEKRRMDLEQEIREEQEEKRQALERLLGEGKRRLEEIRAQCNSAQIISISSTGLGALLALVLLNCLVMG